MDWIRNEVTGAKPASWFWTCRFSFVIRVWCTAGLIWKGFWICLGHILLVYKSRVVLRCGLNWSMVFSGSIERSRTNRSTYRDNTTNTAKLKVPSYKVAKTKKSFMGNCISLTITFQIISITNCLDRRSPVLEKKLMAVKFNFFFLLSLVIFFFFILWIKLIHS